ncbi:MAG: MerR family transcriptional regulator [Streptosporangiaceae bacterium]|jgi:DNA-binding transcriptional MerR regulator
MTTATARHLAGLSIQEVSRRTGFSESTLRYYERIGLIGAVPRVSSSSHRRYEAGTVDTLEALACLRSAGMSIDEMRGYLAGVVEGLAAAPRMAALFAGHAERLEQELAALRVRQAYAAAKAALWQARADGDQAAEQEAAAEVLETMRQLRDHDKETRR